ncbi:MULTISPECIES: endonuclease [unclassified Streptomyces]|uniref:endonuclease n=1 Tax=unclassified Streptomyces TaxID=2593676 RepID=UPI003245A0D3
MTSNARNRKVMRELLRRHGQTYAAEAHIRLKDTPQPLYRTLVLAHLLSARIRASAAVSTSRSLYEAGLRDPKRMTEATWQQRVDALGRGGYRRYDESTASQLGDGGQILIDRWGGDLRRMRAQADGDADELRTLLRELPGIGRVGTDIFLREVQDVWPEFGPFVDSKARQGAERLGLPQETSELVRIADDAATNAAMASALVRAALDKDVVADCLDDAA